MSYAWLLTFGCTVMACLTRLGTGQCHRACTPSSYFRPWSSVACFGRKLLGLASALIRSPYCLPGDLSPGTHPPQVRLFHPFWVTGSSEQFSKPASRIYARLSHELLQLLFRFSDAKVSRSCFRVDTSLVFRTLGIFGKGGLLASTVFTVTVPLRLYIRHTL